jgi:hypothetical protein
MKNIHVEVHSKSKEVEHYICQNCETQAEAIERITTFYKDKDEKIAMYADAIKDPAFTYYIFRIVELEDTPVVYITGEYHSQYPI